MQNAKPKPKKKGREAEKGKENAGEKGKAVPIEIKDTEKAKPKITYKFNRLSLHGGSEWRAIVVKYYT